MTYGADFFRDHSDNSDSSVTTIVGFGPAQSTINDTALTPNATFLTPTTTFDPRILQLAAKITF